MGETRILLQAIYLMASAAQVQILLLSIFLNFFALSLSGGGRWGWFFADKDCCFFFLF